MAKPEKQSPSTIAVNKKAFHNYFIIERLEAGLVLEGWEVKSLRAKGVQLKESYALLKGMEAWLLGAHISPLQTTSTHKVADPRRTRKLLLHRYELAKLIGAVERKGFTLVPLSMYWKKGVVKLEVGIAKGKQKQDKRATLKERDWQRDRQRILRRGRWGNVLNGPRAET